MKHSLGLPIKPFTALLPRNNSSSTDVVGAGYSLQYNNEVKHQTSCLNISPEKTWRFNLFKSAILILRRCKNNLELIRSGSIREKLDRGGNPSRLGQHPPW